MKVTLFRKYALIFSALVGGSLLVSGVLGINSSYQENRRALIELQQEKAQAAAQRIGQYLFDLEQKIGTTAGPKEAVSALEQRAIEIHLLRGTAALKEIALLDPQGKEVLRVSRRGADMVQSGRVFSDSPWFEDVRSGRPYRSSIYFRDNALYMTLAMAVGPRAAGITVAEVDLEFLLDGITRIKVGDSGHAYAVDDQGLLIAHPDIGLVLKRTSLATLPQVKAALQSPALDSMELVDARDRDGRRVLTAFGVIPYLGWVVFVEESMAQAYRPLIAQAMRSAALVLVGMFFTVLACVALVRKMVKPIHDLRDGARLIGRGVFDQPIIVKTGDELEELADEFNRMAGQLQESYASLEQKVSQRTQALTQSEHSLREAQHIAGLGSYVLDIGTDTWKSSEVLDRLLGLERKADHSREVWSALIHPQDLPRMTDVFVNDVMAHGRGFDEVFRAIRLDNHEERWVHALGRPEYSAAGKLVKVHGTIQDITERKQMEDQVRQLAFYDPLTELANRRLLNDRLSQTLLAEKRRGHCGALLFLDLDNFKPLNDAHGHAVGDLLLVEVAHRLIACVRKGDTVARFGGDEFVVMLCELDVSKAEATLEAAAVAEKILTSLSEPFVLTVQREGKGRMAVEHRSSASIGITVFCGADVAAGDILTAADLAMYRAKAAGRNAIRFAEPMRPLNVTSWQT